MKRTSAPFVVSLLLGCASAAEESDRPTPPESVAQHDATPKPTAVEDVETSGNPWHPLVREAASRYASWGVVDNQMHWAPGLCAMPSSGVLHSSVAPADTAHGEKVFLLHAFDAMAYWKATPVKSRLPESLARASDPLVARTDVRQVLVKESFAPKPLGNGVGGRYVPAKKGDAYFGTGDPLGLYVMVQLAADTPDTDAGWIYATVSPTGEVTAAGSLDACRDCHAKEADRVFGMPLQWHER